MKVIVQKWEESERHWGIRPDGYSIHLTEADREAYVKAYWDRMLNETPDEYSRPAGTPYTAEINDVEIAGQGMRFYDNNYPGSGGPDGWMRNGFYFCTEGKSSEEKLAAIAAIYETKRVDPFKNGMIVSTHARYNLEGVIFDMERTGRTDDIGIRTLKRVAKQLADIERILES